MKRKYRVICCFLIAISLVVFIRSEQVNTINISFAMENTSNISQIFKVFSTDGKYLLERENVLQGDEFLTRDFVKYKIVSVDSSNGVAIAKYVEKVEKPKVDIGFSSRPISAEKPVVALYMTHNDESYVPTDSVSSVYGAGGIHDVAKHLKTCLEDEGIRAIVDETLHIPHDSYAYSRSCKTAKNLISEYAPDCLFDIHRDGASRGTYVKNINGVERCKVRIVVGKASANYKTAEQLALYLLAVAEEVCDWLFLDIYYATGHYNQGLHNKALLFEMGSHLVEKQLVMSSVDELAKLINVAFFNTTVDKETGDMTINGEITEQTPTINELFAENTPKSNKFTYNIVSIMVVGFAGAITIFVVWVACRRPIKRKRK